MNIKRLDGDRQLSRACATAAICRSAASARGPTRARARARARARSRRRRPSRKTLMAKAEATSKAPTARQRKRARQGSEEEDIQEARREAHRAPRLRAHPGVVQQHRGDDYRHGRQCGRVVERRRHRLQGIAQGHAVRGDAGGDERRQRGEGGRHAVAGRARQGTGSGRESAIRALQTVGIEVKSIRDVHADSAQRLPATEAEDECNGCGISGRFAGCAGARA